MHLRISTFCRSIFLNRRFLSGIFALLLCCATLSFPSSGGRVHADENGGMGPTPEITGFECHLEGGWIVITGTVSTSGWVEISGITLFSFSVALGETFREQVAYDPELQGTISAVLHSILGPISNIVDDWI